jgi:hypothetical protein
MNWSWLMLAEGEPVTRHEAMELLRTGFYKELASNELIAYVAGAAALVALVIGQRRRPKPVPRRDYLAEAVKVLGLTREERSDLLELAGRAHLSQPAAMLLSPANLAFALNRAPMDGPAGPLRNRLDALSRKLFGEGLPGEARRGTSAALQSVSSTADGSQPV